MSRATAIPAASAPAADIRSHFTVIRRSSHEWAFEENRPFTQQWDQFGSERFFTPLG